jgi:DNA end-binding protein Ku
MASIRSGTIAFGLVAIPVRVYVATHSEQLSFNLLHQGCGARIRQQLRRARIRQQLYCPQCARVVERRELVKGYEVGKHRYVTFTTEELQALAAAASPAIEIHEFVPLPCVDPLYFADGHYLGPDKGGEKAYRLLATAMRATGRVALAQHVSHGKEHLALIRPFKGGLVLHSLYYADEVRPFDGIGAGDDLPVGAEELKLARRLIEQLATEAFHPEAYPDAYRTRLREVVEQKVAGKDVTIVASEPWCPPVIDLMAALKASLSRRGGRGARRRVAPAAAERAETRRPPAAVGRDLASDPRHRTPSRR